MPIEDDEQRKALWLEVTMTLRPDIDLDEFDRMWAEFLEDERRHKMH